MGLKADVQLSNIVQCRDDAQSRAQDIGERPFGESSQSIPPYG
jgi:hypothetical protein